MACTECVTGISSIKARPPGKSIKSQGYNTVGDVDCLRRLLADKYASHGFRVLIPDLIRRFPNPAVDALCPMRNRRWFSSTLRDHLCCLFVPFVVRKRRLRRSRKSLHSNTSERKSLICRVLLGRPVRDDERDLRRDGRSAPVHGEVPYGGD